MKCLGKWPGNTCLIPIYVLTKGATEEAQYNWIMFKPHLATQLTFPDKNLHFLFDDALSHLESYHTTMIV